MAGLSRYDGDTITVYKNSPDNPSSLSDNFVTSLYQDEQGRLWVGTKSALSEKTNEIAEKLNDPKFRRSDLVTFVSVSQSASSLIMRGLQNAADLIDSFKQVAVDRASAQRRTHNLNKTCREIVATTAGKVRKAGTKSKSTSRSILKSMVIRVRLDRSSPISSTPRCCMHSKVSKAARCSSTLLGSPRTGCR